MVQGLILAMAAGAIVSLLNAVLLVATQSRHGRFSLDVTHGVQKFHATPTPRIGGIAIVAGLVAALLALRQDLLLTILVASAPAFLVGLAEDLTKRVSVSARLAATLVSSLIASLLTGVTLTRVDVIGLDLLLAYYPISILFTAFAVSGVANAYNIIDGFNGLAGGVVLITLGALAAVAAQVGDTELVGVCLVLMGVSVGFLALNFPFGKIFLGDGGAYLLGFMVAWVAVLLPMRNPAVSGWASLLACGYPILETLFSIRRKSKRQGSHPGQPDRVHLHMLLYRRVSRRLYPHCTLPLQNALTSPFAWAFALLPASIAVVWPTSTPVLVGGFLLSACVYWAIYLRLTQFRWCLVPQARLPREIAGAQRL